jgi:hypothetical protein
LIRFFEILDTDFTSELGGCTVPDTLEVDQSFECIIGPIAVEETSLGQHMNMATATGVSGVTTVDDSDYAYYFATMGSGTYPYCIEGCNAKEFTLDYVYLDLTDTCTPGEGMWIDVIAVLDPHVTRQCFLFAGDLYIGDPPIYDRTFIYTDDEILSTETEINLGSIYWTCGQSIELINNYYAYKTPGGAGGGCGGPTCDAWQGVSPAKCGHPDDVIVIVPHPSINVKKLVSVDNGVTWWDADSPTGPGVFVGENVLFRINVTNNGNVDLYGVTLTDTDFTTCAVPSPLNSGTRFTCNLGPFPAQSGQHKDTATATVVHGGVTYQDSDDAHYYGCTLANAGDDKLVCAGDTLPLVGIPDPCETCSVSGWEKDPTCLGVLETPIEGDYNRAEYTPPETGEASCKLYFNMTGTCCDSDNMTIYVVPDPEARIALAT